MVRKEIEDAITSGASVVFTKKNDSDIDDIVGCWLNQVWTKNPEYEAIGANARFWHDAASEIAMNHPDKSMRHLIWRKLQFLHIYDVGQTMLNQMPQKKYVLYLGAGFVNQELRDLDIMEQAFSIVQNEWDTKDCIIYMITTFYQMEPYITKRISNPHIVDEIRYEEETLKLNGTPCFKSFEHLGGIKFVVNFNAKETCPDYNAFPEG